jgi:hypothetical protein
VTRGSARLAFVLAALAAVLSGCTHLHAVRLWPFHHGASPPPEAVSELVAETPAGSSVAVSQYWDRNTLLVDLSTAAGDGGLRLRPAAGATWPVRIEFRVQPGSIARLEVEGAQRVTYAVPASGSPVVLKLDPGVYTARTAALDLAWHAAGTEGG